MNNHKSKLEWEKEFIAALIRVRDAFSIEDSLSLIGLKNAEIVESLISGYFSERRGRIHIKKPSCYMNFEDVINFINDVVLDYMSDEHIDFLELDWQNKYVLKSEITDIFFNEDDKQDYC